MNVEIFSLCDAATEHGGKLNLLGAFDMIFAQGVPVNHPHCSIALRIRFERVEEGDHSFRLVLINADGQPVVPGMEGNMNMRVPPEAESTAVNLAINLQGLPLKEFGTYYFDLAIDGRQVARLPLTVRRAPPQP